MIQWVYEFAGLAVVEDDIQMVGVTEEDAGDRFRWRQMIRCNNT